MTTRSEVFGSFGSLLKSFRKNKHITQEQLAAAIGVHRNAIGRWEQGDVLPASRGMILEIARYLHLDGQETRQLLEASLTALVPHWCVPFPRNPFFTGREEVLETLHAYLSSSDVVALTQSYALQGLGGIGKTQIALEYVYRYALEHSAVFWIEAETDGQVVASLQRIVETLQLPGQNEKDQRRVIAAVQNWLSAHDQWLMIWDNIEDLALLRRFLSTVRSGAILLTTRRQAPGTLARSLSLLPMEPEEGLLFLLRRARVLAPEAADEQVRQFSIQAPVLHTAASELVTVLGGLPLALDQAGAYLEETHCGLSAYLDLFQIRRDALLQRRGEGIYDHPASVSTTFTLAITAAAGRHPAVKELLQICALLQPDAIPEELFRQGGEHLGPTLEVAGGDPLEWDSVMSVACSYSLLARQSEEQTISLHRLVQAVLLDAMAEDERQMWTQRIIKALDALFPRVLSSSEYAIMRQCNRLASHALLCLRRTGAGEESLFLASLAAKMAEYLRECGQYAEAETLSQRALSIREQLLDADHPDIAYSLNGLALLYWYQGKYEQAEPLYQRAVQIGERVPGPKQYDMASPISNLANLYFEQGKYGLAEPLYWQALHIREQAFGEAHPRLIYPLNGLANLYAVQGKHRQAELLYQRAVSIGEQELGQTHPQVAYPLNSLAELYTEQGKYRQAGMLYRRALRIREQALGPEHPCVAESLYGLANLFQKQNKAREAKYRYQRALLIWEQALGPEHPYVAYSLNGLANLLQGQGQYVEVEELYQRALSIREQHLGQQHPEIAETLYDLAMFRQRQGRQSEALPLVERALHIRSQFLGDVHPKTIATRAFYTRLLQGQADGEKTVSARDIEEEVSDARSAALPAGELRLSLHGDMDASFATNDPLSGFLEACCERHPDAWCRSADLWQAYEGWVEEYQERFPFSRGAFIAQLKAHGFRADRITAARIWRGITLIKKET